MEFKIGLAQIAPKLGDIAANLELHLDIVRRTREQGVDLLVFPELSLTGYSLGDAAFDVAIRATAGDPTFGRLMAASEEVDLVASFVEVDDRHRHYITAAYLSGGLLVHRHRKVYLPTYGLFNESRNYTPGDAARAFDTRFGRMGLLICEDLWHASLPYVLWQDGADILILISASVEHGQDEAMSTADKVLAMTRAYALQFTDFVIHVNQAGEDDSGCYWGGSILYGPDASIIVEGPRDAPAVVIGTIDTALIGPARRALPLLRDERADLTLRELSRIARDGNRGVR
jgi:predicted amidohydrolase